jgi:hypothetical protein
VIRRVGNRKVGPLKARLRLHTGHGGLRCKSPLMADCPTWTLKLELALKTVCCPSDFGWRMTAVAETRLWSFS